MIWTDEEKRRLISEWERGTTLKQICFSLNRKKGAVLSMKRKLGASSRRDKSKGVRLHVSMSAAMLERVRQRAFHLQMSFPDYVRMIIRRDLG